jgi:hypothetical protein
MTDPSADSPSEPAPALPAPGSTRSVRRIRWLAATAVALVLIVSLIEHLFPSPDLFSHGNQLDSVSTVGQPTVIGMGMIDHRTTLKSAEPALDHGSAAAVITVVLCERDHAGDSLGTVHNVVALATYCDRVAPVSGAKMRAAHLPDGPTDLLVAIVVPIAAGKVSFSGLKVTHIGRWGQKTDRSGPNVSIVVNG